MPSNLTHENAIRLKFETHGSRNECFARAYRHFDRTFEDGWRLTYVEEELDTGHHEVLGRVAENDEWDCRYDAIGIEKEVDFGTSV